MVKLSILIPTIVGREEQYNSLVSELHKQYDGDEVEICSLKDNREMPIGEKRNKLLEMAKGEYVVSIDDDDSVSDNYIELLLKAAESGCDCASLKGVITTDGQDAQIFEHSLKYSEWRTTGNEVKYERYENHLNMIRSSIAKQFKFPETYFGEDHEWSKAIHEAGVLKTEHYIDEILYYYKYISNK